jgi:hypothetical protein
LYYLLKKASYNTFQENLGYVWEFLADCSGKIPQIGHTSAESALWATLGKRKYFEIRTIDVIVIQFL